MSDALPPNIDEFNQIVAVVFAKLYIAHPVPKTLEVAEIAEVLGVSPTATLGSGRSFDEIFEHTMRWLLDQHYTHSYACHARERAVLTDKALFVMNAVPSNLDQRTRGSELVEATQQANSESGRRKLGELTGALFGAMLKAMMD
jgi:hypothetical protein